MSRKPYEYFTGKDLFNKEEEAIEPIVEGLIYPKDYILFIAGEKMGKTIFVQNLICKLSIGKPFLNTFDITKPCKVVYLPTEVKVHELKERFEIMGDNIGIDKNNIHLIPTYFKYNEEQGGQKYLDEIIKLVGGSADMVIIDSLYKAVKGSITSDDVITQFNDKVDYLIRALNCAVIVVHHLRKPTRKPDSEDYYHQNDKDSFGSAFLTAGVDHVLRLEKCAKNPMDRILKCDTQRSGKIVDIIRLTFDEKTLSNGVTSTVQEEINIIKEFVYANPDPGVTAQDLMFETRLGKTTVYKVLKALQETNDIYKTGTRTKFYKPTHNGCDS